VVKQSRIEFFGDDVIGKEASYYFEGTQDTYDAVHPIFAGAKALSTLKAGSGAKDGEKRLLGWWCRALKDTSGNVTGALSSARDITERKRMEEALQASEGQLSNALKIAHLGHWEYDVASDLFTFNDYFYAMLHTTAGQMGSYTLSSSQYAQRFVHPDDMALVGVEIQKALETTDPHYTAQLEHRIIYADGEAGYISVRIFVVKDERVAPSEPMV